MSLVVTTGSMETNSKEECCNRLVSLIRQNAGSALEEKREEILFSQLRIFHMFPVEFIMLSPSKTRLHLFY